MLKKLAFLVPAIALAGSLGVPAAALAETKVVIKRGGHHHAMAPRSHTKVVIKSGHRRPSVTKKVVIHRSE
jgi:hypothetical protein